MSIPRFTAEASLYPSRNRYVTRSGAGSPLGRGAVPAVFCRDLVYDATTGYWSCADNYPSEHGGGGAGGGGDVSFSDDEAGEIYGSTGVGEQGWPLPPPWVCTTSCYVGFGLCLAWPAVLTSLPGGPITKWLAGGAGAVCGALLRNCLSECS